MTAPLGELWFNQKAGQPGADEAVRRALTQALDLTQLGQVLTGGSGKPATGLVAPARTVHPEHDRQQPAGPQRGRRQVGLDAAGWTAGADGARAKAGRS